ncbi:MAG: hypothetical protein IJC43_10190 [Clostridia bacterium]|nr:hypothetical protein [Clostridia bacterium]
MISRLFDSKPFVRLFSLLMACVIWLFVKAGNPDAEMTFRGVEINVITQNAQLENAVSVVEMSGQTVDVTLRGGKELLGRITAADIHAAIEVDASLSPGYYNFPITLTLPLESLTVTGKNPAGVDVWLDRTGTITVPIELSFTNHVEGEDYVVREPLLSSDQLEITGPVTELAGIKSARVEVDLTEQNMAEPMLSLPLTLLDKNGQPVDTENLETSQRAVTVRPQVFLAKTLPVSVSFLNYPRSWASSDFHYTVEPQYLDLLVPIGQKTNIPTQYDAGIIDLAQYRMSQTVQLPVTTSQRAEDQPENIRVSLRFGALKTTTAELETVLFDNVGEGIGVELLTVMPLTVELRGSAAAVENYDPADLRATVDLDGLQSGQTAELPLRITTGDDRVGVVGSSRVIVRLEE